MNELKELIIHNLDVVDFLDLIGKDISDLVDVFEDDIIENERELWKAVD